MIVISSILLLISPMYPAYNANAFGFASFKIKRFYAWRSPLKHKYALICSNILIYNDIGKGKKTFRAALFNG